MFKSGDLIIGKDGSYQRSIYEVVEVKKQLPFDVVLVILRSFDKLHASTKERENVLIRPLANFRLATEVEVFQEKLNYKDTYCQEISQKIKEGKIIPRMCETPIDLEFKDENGVVIASIKTKPEAPEVSVKKTWE